MQDKRSRIVKAKGEAQAAKLLGEAMERSSSFLELRRVETARDIATTLSKSRNRIFLESDTLLLNLTGGLDANLEKRAPGSSSAASKENAKDTSKPSQK